MYANPTAAESANDTISADPIWPNQTDYQNRAKTFVECAFGHFEAMGDVRVTASAIRVLTALGLDPERLAWVHVLTRCAIQYKKVKAWDEEIKKSQYEHCELVVIQKTFPLDSDRYMSILQKGQHVLLIISSSRDIEIFDLYSGSYM